MFDEYISAGRIVEYITSYVTHRCRAYLDSLHNTSQSDAKLLSATRHSVPSERSVGRPKSIGHDQRNTRVQGQVRPA